MCLQVPHRLQRPTTAAAAGANCLSCTEPATSLVSCAATGSTELASGHHCARYAQRSRPWNFTGAKTQVRRHPGRHARVGVRDRERQLLNATYQTQPVGRQLTRRRSGRHGHDQLDLPDAERVLAHVGDPTALLRPPITGLTATSVITCEDCHTGFTARRSARCSHNWGLDPNYPGDYSYAELTKYVTANQAWPTTERELQHGGFRVWYRDVPRCRHRMRTSPARRVEHGSGWLRPPPWPTVPTAPPAPRRSSARSATTWRTSSPRLTVDSTAARSRGCQHGPRQPPPGPARRFGPVRELPHRHPARLEGAAPARQHRRGRRLRCSDPQTPRYHSRHEHRPAVTSLATPRRPLRFRATALASTVRACSP